MVPDHDLAGALEAVLLVVDAPVTETALATAVGTAGNRVRAVLVDLAARYTAASSGIELRELGGGWRFYTRDRFAPVVERFVLDGAQSRLSRAALETLAVVAYRQPVTRARIAAVRGVNVDGVVRTLMSRGLIEDVGTDPTPADCCTAPPTVPGTAWFVRPGRNCRRSAHCCRTSTGSTMSDPRSPPAGYPERPPAGRLRTIRNRPAATAQGGSG